MRRFFADTFYWVALLLRRDTWHTRVTAFSHTLRDEAILFTTDAVLLEFLAALSAAGPHLRHQAAERVAGMFTDPSMRVMEVTRAVPRRASPVSSPTRQGIQPGGLHLDAGDAP